MHFSRQLNCWSLRCSWSIACRRCSNYIFILNLTPGFNGLGKDNNKMRREAFKFWGLVFLILETLWYIDYHRVSTMASDILAGLLKPIRSLVDMNFLTWLLIGWQQSCQPIRAYLEKCYTCMWIVTWISFYDIPQFACFIQIVYF